MINLQELELPMSRTNFHGLEQSSMIPKMLESLKFDFITKTNLYNVDPLKPHFYKVKLGFTGIYIILLISAQNIDRGYSLEPPRRGGSKEYPQFMF